MSAESPTADEYHDETTMLDATIPADFSAEEKTIEETENFVQTARSRCLVNPRDSAEIVDPQNTKVTKHYSDDSYVIEDTRSPVVKWHGAIVREFFQTESVKDRYVRFSYIPSESLFTVTYESSGRIPGLATVHEVGVSPEVAREIQDEVVKYIEDAAGLKTVKETPTHNSLAYALRKVLEGRGLLSDD